MFQIFNHAHYRCARPVPVPVGRFGRRHTKKNYLLSSYGKQNKSMKVPIVPTQIRIRLFFFFDKLSDCLDRT
jgi:hypothetical protein